MNAEIITKRVANVQEAVDYLTWSFYYRRLTQNPNYYNLQGVSHRHLSDHLSELVEGVLEQLKQSKCISIEEDGKEVAPLNLGMIAAYYYIRYTTVEKFSNSLQPKSTLPELLEILCSSAEFEQIQVRHREDYALKKLAAHLPLKIPDAKHYTEPSVKTNVLLQSHYSRAELAAAAKQDQAKILPIASRLLQAMVDVISSSGWLEPALAAMELSQMVTMGCWNTDSRLLQLPHMDKALAKKCEQNGIDTVTALLEMDDDARAKLLGLKADKRRDVAVACNNYPDIEFKFQVNKKDDIKAGSRVSVGVSLTRDPDEEDDDKQVGVPKVVAPRYPQVKTEGWWLVIGSPRKNELTAIKRIAMKKKSMKVDIDFVAPEKGDYKYMIYLMSDSYLGADQEYEFSLTVQEGEAAAESESSSESDNESDKE
jgi:pre-mRNA-splicing helicase BRR2